VAAGVAFADEARQLLPPAPTGTANTSSTPVLALDRPLVKHPFFTSLGPNGRTCADCQLPFSGASTTPADVRAGVAATQRTEAVFRPADGAVSPTAGVSTPATRRALAVAQQAAHPRRARAPVRRRVRLGGV
jgi:hypothetical protein